LVLHVRTVRVPAPVAIAAATCSFVTRIVGLEGAAGLGAPEPSSVGSKAVLELDGKLSLRTHLDNRCLARLDVLVVETFEETAQGVANVTLSHPWNARHDDPRLVGVGKPMVVLGRRSKDLTQDAHRLATSLGECHPAMARAAPPISLPLRERHHPRNPTRLDTTEVRGLA
jgi:hypothetical protein